MGVQEKKRDRENRKKNTKKATQFFHLKTVTMQ